MTSTVLWPLTEDETPESFEAWRINFINILSEESSFIPFLKPECEWSRKTRAKPFRGFTGADAASRAAALDRMLGLIANYARTISRFTIVTSSTSLNSVWSSIRLYYGIQPSSSGPSRPLQKEQYAASKTYTHILQTIETPEHSKHKQEAEVPLSDVAAECEDQEDTENDASINIQYPDRMVHAEDDASSTNHYKLQPPHAVSSTNVSTPAMHSTLSSEPSAMHDHKDCSQTVHISAAPSSCCSDVKVQHTSPMKLYSTDASMHLDKMLTAINSSLCSGLPPHRKERSPEVTTGEVVMLQEHRDKVEHDNVAAHPEDTWTTVEHSEASSVAVCDSVHAAALHTEDRSCVPSTSQTPTSQLACIAQDGTPGCGHALQSHSAEVCRITRLLMSMDVHHDTCMYMAGSDTAIWNSSRCLPY